ncbi:hypothetical protein [Bradyrhizobium sp. NC92]|uniref:hypothetical protein n=1 Tax=Bradyrhizobium sp. (strain NC92) TaxID=55395 RepID=UPI0021AA7E1E|nr:hypothetical protein [Bradyrhizobium sp. NC92]UWU72611.1 hypothetical protein N2602_19415 [Bradyrhizobium sp. NC92]
MIEAWASLMGRVTTLVLTTPASIARYDIATTATADAIAILVSSDCRIQKPTGPVSPGVYIVLVGTVQRPAYGYPRVREERLIESETEDSRQACRIA